MTTALYTHTDCLTHSNGPDHPESPERLKALISEFEQTKYSDLLRRDAPLADLNLIARVHDRSYIDGIFASIPQIGHSALNPDTGLSPGSGKAALRAAGAVLAAVDDVMKGVVSNAFCAVRPPGHHARYREAMGFCLFNNIALGAAHVLHTYKLHNIVIVDFDVHHGNGTEDWARTQKEIHFFSSHQSPLWPGSGHKQDRGELKNLVNVPLSAETNSKEFRRILTDEVLAPINQLAPEFIFISAGFDAHRDDPLSAMQLVADDFGWITGELCQLAHIHCRGRIVSSLEGGYNLPALAQSAGAHVEALLKASKGPSDG